LVWTFFQKREKINPRPPNPSRPSRRLSHLAGIRCALQSSSVLPLRAYSPSAPLHSPLLGARKKSQWDRLHHHVSSSVCLFTHLLTVKLYSVANCSRSSSSSTRVSTKQYLSMLFKVRKSMRVMSLHSPVLDGSLFQLQKTFKLTSTHILGACFCFIVSFQPLFSSDASQTILFGVSQLTCLSRYYSFTEFFCANAALEKLILFGVWYVLINLSTSCFIVLLLMTLSVNLRKMRGTLVFLYFPTNF
jgi:hypothetical protein